MKNYTEDSIICCTFAAKYIKRMVMKRINYLSLAILAISLFAFSACEEEAGTIAVPIDDFTVDVATIIESNELPIESNASLRSDDEVSAFKPFSGSATIDINDVDFMKLLEYQSHITGVNIGAASITLTVKEATVKNVVISASGVEPNFTIESYTFGEEFPFSSEKLLEYVNKVFKQFILSGKLTISISGETDVDENFMVKILFGDIDVKAKLIDIEK